MGRTPSTSSIRLALCGALLLLYVLIVLTATMWPTPLDQNYASAIERVLSVLHRHGLPEWFGYSKLEFSANIAMFVPMGFLLSLTLPQRAWWSVVLLAPAFSGGIELTQGAFLEQRFASVLDVVANTMGGYLGAVLAHALRALVHARDRLLLESLATVRRRPLR